MAADADRVVSVSGTERGHDTRPGIVSDPSSARYGSPCNRHERDPFSPMRCWKCGAKMRAPAMRGGGG